MSTIRVVTDSASSLTNEMAEQYDISVVPIWIQIGEKSFRDGIDLSIEEFYSSLDGKVIPKTSSPPINEFISVYQRLVKKAKEIISVHITSDGSATCQVASLASQSLEKGNVTVYDSKAVSMGVGFLAIEAAKAARQGLNKEEILARLDAIRNNLRTYVAIPTLKYLEKSGRVRKGQAILASLLSIKPIVEIKDGMLKVTDKVRTFSKALAKILDLTAAETGNVPTVVAVMHANAREEAERFAKKVKARINVAELIIGEVGPALAIHGGPGMIGIVTYPAITKSR